ncbi:hypothetical protein E3P78_02682 [Wallemia ichthyophaga]|nr:hypothetical protein E3P78_02682 [Wallemia ichthyophaga]
MGATLSGLANIFKPLFFWNGGKECRILMLGLDAAGKTTIIYRLQLGEVIQTIPTIGFNVESIDYNGLKLNVWDLGGQTSIRPYWRCYYANTQAIIYVVDSTDTERLPTSRSELITMLSEDELKDAKLLVLANKQDSPDALPASEVSLQLGLDSMKDRAGLAGLSGASAYTILAGSYNASLTTYTFDSDKSTIGYGKKHSLPQGFAPSWIQESPVNDSLVAVCSETFPGSVASTLIEDAENHSVVNTLPSGGDGPASGGFTADGKCFVAANYASGSIQAYSVADDGKISNLGKPQQLSGSGPNKERQTSPHPHHVVASPLDDKTVYIPDLGSDRILQFAIKNDNLDKVAEYETPAGSGPRHGVFHPELPILYVITELSNEVLVFKVDDSCGLEQISKIGIVPESKKNKTSMQASEIGISSDGKYIYAANRDVKPADAKDEDHLAIITVGEKGEELSVKGHAKVGGIQPRAFKLFGAKEEYLIVGNTYENDPNVGIFQRDTLTGEVKQAAKQGGQSPTSFIWLADLIVITANNTHDKKDIFQDLSISSNKRSKQGTQGSQCKDSRFDDITISYIDPLLSDPFEELKNCVNSAILREIPSPGTYMEFNNCDQGTVTTPSPPIAKYYPAAFEGNVEVSGIIHLYKDSLSLEESDNDAMNELNFIQTSSSAALSSAERNSVVGILAVPSSMSPSDLLEFIRPALDAISHIRILRDAAPNRFITVIKFKDFRDAIEFKDMYDGTPFSSLNEEICRVVRISSVEIQPDSSNMKPSSFELSASDGWISGANQSIELPTCPVSFTVPAFQHGLTLDVQYGPGHAYRHYEETTHLFSLDLATQRVWDYAGDGYVHRLIQKSDGKVVELPSATSSYSQLASKSKQRDNNPEQDEEGIEKKGSGAEDEMVALEFSALLASQLETQRYYFENKQAYLNARVESLEMAIESQRNMVDPEEGLIKENNRLEKKVSKSAEILHFNESQNEIIAGLSAENTELKENVRDLMFFMEAREKVPTLAEGEMAGGSVGVAPPPPSYSKQKKKKKKKEKKPPQGASASESTTKPALTPPN